MPCPSEFLRGDRDSEIDAETLGAIPSLGTISLPIVVGLTKRQE